MEQHLQSLKARAELALEQLSGRAEGCDEIAASILDDLRTALREVPGAGGLLGPLIERVEAARKARTESEAVRWVCVAGGHLAIGHRPKIKAIQSFQRHGVTHILTLLSAAEGAAQIGATAKAAALDWIWFPLTSASPPQAERLPEVRLLYRNLREVLAAGGKVYVHCSAGIHRTGMISYGFLRSIKLSQTDAIAILHELRAETGKGVGDSRLQWGEQFADDAEH